MKIIKQTIMWLAFALGCSSCSSLFYDAKADVLQSIHRGMSKQEVTKLLGTPKYLRFDRDMEEWEYLKILSSSGYTTIVVSFEGDKVVAMDSFPAYPSSSPSVTVVPSEVVVATPGTTYVKRMRSEDFQRFYDKVKSRPFKDDQFEMMRIASENNSLTCRQCARLMSLYAFDDDKMAVLGIFASHIADRENYEVILEGITSLFTKDDVKKLLGIRY